jgi:hypothetical protein
MVAAFALPYPDLYAGNHVMFLRKGIGSEKSHTRVAKEAEHTVVGTAIFVPVHVAQYHIGSYYQGMTIENEIGAHRALRNEMQRVKSMWATVSEEPFEGNEQRLSRSLAGDLSNYYCESPLFELSVSELNPFKDRFLVPLKSQSYSTVVWIS